MGRQTDTVSEGGAAVYPICRWGQEGDHPGDQLASFHTRLLKKKLHLSPSQRNNF